MVAVVRWGRRAPGEGARCTNHPSTVWWWKRCMDVTATTTSRLLATTPVATTTRLVAVVPEEVVVEEVCFACYSHLILGSSYWLCAAVVHLIYFVLNQCVWCTIIHTACKQERKKLEKLGGHDICNVEYSASASHNGDVDNPDCDVVHR